MSRPFTAPRCEVMTSRNALCRKPARHVVKILAKGISLRCCLEHALATERFWVQGGLEVTRLPADDVAAAEPNYLHRRTKL